MKSYSELLDESIDQTLVEMDAEEKAASARIIERREALAAYSHEAWSDWMNYQLSKAKVNQDGTWTIPVQSAERWYRQMTTPYHLLPESEKTSDRAEADKILSIAEKYL